LALTVPELLALSRHDAERPRSARFARVDAWLGRALVHPQDAFMVRRFLVLALSAAFAAWATFHRSWWAVLLVYAAILVQGETIGLFMHMHSHRKLWRKPFRLLDVAPTWLVSPWIGEPPFLFATEHVLNHHAQDNGPRDLGCTMHCQRDSWRDLGRYIANFVAGRSGAIGLSRVVRSNARQHLSWRFHLGQLLFGALFLVMLWVDWIAALLLVAVPYLFVQAANRANNWTEHAFINPDCPHDPLGNAYTIVASRFNTVSSYSEGYHATHHLHPGLPNHLWPQSFQDEMEAYRAADHLVFQDTSSNDIFFMLMNKDYRALARHYVPWPDRPRTEDQVVAMLRGRVARFPAAAASGVTPSVAAPPRPQR
jgi:fatty acid desaturase